MPIEGENFVEQMQIAQEKFSHEEQKIKRYQEIYNTIRKEKLESEDDKVTFPYSMRNGNMGLGYCFMNQRILKLKQQAMTPEDWRIKKERYAEKKRKLEDIWHKSNLSDVEEFRRESTYFSYVNGRKYSKKEREYYEIFNLRQLEKILKSNNRGKENSDLYNSVATDLEIYNLVSKGVEYEEKVQLLKRLEESCENYLSARSPKSDKGKIRYAIISQIQMLVKAHLKDPEEIAKEDPPKKEDVKEELSKNEKCESTVVMEEDQKERKLEDVSSEKKENEIQTVPTIKKVETVKVKIPGSLIKKKGKVRITYHENFKIVRTENRNVELGSIYIPGEEYEVEKYVEEVTKDKKIDITQTGEEKIQKNVLHVEDLVEEHIKKKKEKYKQALIEEARDSYSKFVDEIKKGCNGEIKLLHTDNIGGMKGGDVRNFYAKTASTTLNEKETLALNNALRSHYKLISSDMRGDIELNEDQRGRYDKNMRMLFLMLYYEKVDESQLNSLTTKFFNVIGWSSRKPMICKNLKSRMKTYPKRQLLFHTISPCEAVPMRDMIKQVIGEGSQYYSNDHVAIGQGIYAATELEGEVPNIVNQDDILQHKLRNIYGGGEDSVRFTLALNEKAKIVDRINLRGKNRDLEKKYPKIFKWLVEQVGQTINNVGCVMSIEAALRGYNVIKSSKDSIDRYIILDREAISIDSDIRINTGNKKKDGDYFNCDINWYKNRDVNWYMNQLPQDFSSIDETDLPYEELLQMRSRYNFEKEGAPDTTDFPSKFRDFVARTNHYEKPKEI